MNTTHIPTGIPVIIVPQGTIDELVEMNRMLIGQVKVLTETVNDIVSGVKGDAKTPTLLNQRSAAYYVSTGGQLPADTINPPKRGLTNFWQLVANGEIAYVLRGHKKFFEITELDRYLRKTI